MSRLVVDVLSGTPAGAVAAGCLGGRVAAVEIGAATPREAVSRLARRLRNPGFDLAGNAAGRQLREYFAGERLRFGLDWDLKGLPAFCRKVLRACAKVPFGQIVTYGDIARAAGSPGAARAVGQALKGNPIPIIIPCHRVVGAMSLGGFSAGGGAMTKRALLEFEGVDVSGFAAGG